MKTSRPIYMPELAELLWPGAYDPDDAAQRKTGCQRARLFLHRLEQQRDVQLLFEDGNQGRHRIYTALHLLKRHAPELVDIRAALEREVQKLCAKQQRRIVALSKAQQALGQRQRDVTKLQSEALARIDRGQKELQSRLGALLNRLA